MQIMNGGFAASYDDDLTAGTERFFCQFARG